MAIEQLDRFTDSLPIQDRLPDTSEGIYFAELRRTPALLSRDEEMALCWTMAAGRLAYLARRLFLLPINPETRKRDNYAVFIHPETAVVAADLQNLSGLEFQTDTKTGGVINCELTDPDNPPSADLNLLDWYVTQGRKAYDMFVECNLRLVVPIANKYINKSLPLIDLVQEGNRGVISAIGKYNPYLGFKFSTYATAWIRQAISRAVENKGNTVRLPIHMGGQIRNLIETTHRLTQKLGAEPTEEQVAEELGTTTAQVRSINSAMIISHPTSLEIPVGPNGADSLGSLIGDRTGVITSPVEKVEVAEHSEQIALILKTYLTPRQRRIIEYRFGFFGEKYTLSEIGLALDISRERARQIEEEALTILRKPELKQIFAELFY